MVMILVRGKFTDGGGWGGPPRGPRRGLQGDLNPRMGGQWGETETISQPVDPGGVGGFGGASWKCAACDIKYFELLYLAAAH